MKTQLLVLALLCAITACSTAPIEKLQLPQSALNTNARYALLWIKPCHEKMLGGCEADDGRTTEAKFVAHGSASQVDLKQEYDDSVALSAAIARINAAPSVRTHFLRALKQDIASRQLNVVAVAEPIYEGAMTKRSSRRVLFDDVPLIGATQFPLQLKANTYDFATIHDQLSSDYLIVMELLKFSVERHYGPTGRAADIPQVVSAIRMSVHERTSNQVIFDDYAYEVSMANKDWDTPPYYRSLEANLLASLERAIAKAKRNLLQ